MLGHPNKGGEPLKSDGTLSASLEDYLEAIHHIILDKQAARAKDIAQSLNLKGPSVTGALQALSQKGLINYAPYDLITLTPKGKKIAKDVVHRHQTLRDFLTQILRIEETEAELNACKMEHNISPAVLDRLIQLTKFFELCPRGTDNWVEAFEYYDKTGELQDVCQRCSDVSPKAPNMKTPS